MYIYIFLLLILLMPFIILSLSLLLRMKSMRKFGLAYNFNFVGVRPYFLTNLTPGGKPMVTLEGVYNNHKFLIQDFTKWRERRTKIFIDDSSLPVVQFYRFGFTSIDFLKKVIENPLAYNQNIEHRGKVTKIWSYVLLIILVGAILLMMKFFSA